MSWESDELKKGTQQTMTKPNREVEEHYDYSGSCAPRASELRWGAQKTFSVGIFQWVRKEKGGLKRSAVVYRISGSVHTPEKVYQRAEEVYDLLDGGLTLVKKSETVA